MRASLAFASVAMLAACAGTPKPTPQPPAPREAQVEPARPDPQVLHARAAALVQEHDRAHDWLTACDAIAKQFLDASALYAKRSGGHRLAEAEYGAGVAYLRCGKSREARFAFTAAVAERPAYPRARAELLMLDADGPGAASEAIDELARLVKDDGFKDAFLLVELAKLQLSMPVTGACEPGDVASPSCALMNLQRALAIEPGSLAARNQLALYYLRRAEPADDDAGAMPKGRVIQRQLVRAQRRPDEMSAAVLGLAALVCKEAIELDPSYAPIHNTLGLIQLGLGEVSAALGEFAAATQLDPSLFEAHANLGAERLAIRDFAGAEEAYRRGLSLRPSEYDAHLGLAVALRGRLGPDSPPADVDQVLAELDACKRLAEDRAEAYYNAGLLLQDRARWSAADKEKAAGYARAASDAFDAFLTKPLQPGHEEQRRRAKEAIEDLRSSAELVR